jgi:uncharacterized membrane protein
MVYFLTNQGYFWCGLLFSGGIAFLTFKFLDTGELGFLLAFLVWLILLIVNIVFYKTLKAPTLQGRKLMDQIEGFRQYLSVTEKDRLNILNPPEKTPELFEKYFPYALALDVEQKWSEQFSDVLKAAAEKGYSPGWYSGSDWSYRSPGRFGSQLSGTFTSMIAASSHAPGSSSGGGGGGGSGGGGGGGGGGGW